MLRFALFAAVLCLAAGGTLAADGGTVEVQRIRPLAVDLSEPVFLKAGALLCTRQDATSGSDCRRIKARTPVQVIRLGSQTIHPRLRVTSLAPGTDLSGWVGDTDVEN